MNQRPSGYEPDELPDCSTPRRRDNSIRMPDPRKPGGRQSSMILVDAANVIGSRPDGWWKDRPGAAGKLVAALRQAHRPHTDAHTAEPVVVVLEGQAKRGAPEGTEDNVTVVHAPGEGDDTIVQRARIATGNTIAVTADRQLKQRLRDEGATVVGPSWLIERFGL